MSLMTSYLFGDTIRESSWVPYSDGVVKCKGRVIMKSVTTTALAEFLSSSNIEASYNVF
jgi:hypothetical protein